MTELETLEEDRKQILHQLYQAEQNLILVEEEYEEVVRDISTLENELIDINRYIDDHSFEEPGHESLSLYGQY